MNSGRIPAERQQTILDLIHENGVVRVNELSDLLNVSVLTIRRDLDELGSRGFLERTHGGAVLRRNMPVEPLYSHKEQVNTAQKELIARKAASFIEDGDTVVINSGSTTHAVVNALVNKKITIITNNIDAVRAADDAQFSLIFLGGTYRPQSRSVTGENGLLALEGVYANKAIIGVDGFSLLHGLTTPIMQEAEMTRKMIAQTVGTVIVAADSSKIGVVSNYKTADMSRINYLVTDNGGRNILSEKELQEAGVELILAG